MYFYKGNFFLFTHISFKCQKSPSPTLFTGEKKKIPGSQSPFSSRAATHLSKRGIDKAFENTACMLQHIYLKILPLLFRNTPSKPCCKWCDHQERQVVFMQEVQKSPLMWSIRGALYNSLGPTKGTFCCHFFYSVVSHIVLTYIAWGSQPTVGTSQSCSRREWQFVWWILCASIYMSGYRSTYHPFSLFNYLPLTHFRNKRSLVGA